jgi:antitoxin PrlF
MPSATVTSKGRITLPKEVRTALGLRPGDRVAFRQSADGSFIVEAETIELLELQGRIRQTRKVVTVDDMKDAIRRGATRSLP